MKAKVMVQIPRTHMKLDLGLDLCNAFASLVRWEMEPEEPLLAHGQAALVYVGMKKTPCPKTR